MSLQVRTGEIDVAIVAGANVKHWPSVGAWTAAQVLGEFGLKAGIYGGTDTIVRGILPSGGSGGVVMVEDVQKRIHRIQARAMIRISPPGQFPDPFPGWFGPGLLPLSTAKRVLSESKLHLDQSVAILGTGNDALRFGADLLQVGVKEVNCIESHGPYGKKPYAGWEVERRRFEWLGGKIIFGKPVSLAQRSPLVWDFRVQDHAGVRILEVSRLISSGPFGTPTGFNESPMGSLLFDLDQTSEVAREKMVWGWTAEEDRARWIAVKLVRALANSDELTNRDAWNRVSRRARFRLKRHEAHLDRPRHLGFQGKWLDSRSQIELKEFTGTPKRELKKRLVAQVECQEPIACDLCQKVCPHDAIPLKRVASEDSPAMVLNEDACTACGLCLPVCPSASITMVHERSDKTSSILVFALKHIKGAVAEGQLVTLLNRRGESMGSGRVSKIDLVTAGGLVHIEVHHHLVDQVRAIQSTHRQEVDEQLVALAIGIPSGSVEVQLNGERRFLRDGATLTSAMFETGHARHEDVLFCTDGSCGLCDVIVDGVRQQACQTKVHGGMSIRVNPRRSSDIVDSEHLASNSDAICPCMGLKTEQLKEWVRTSAIEEPKTAVEMTGVMRGRCHGQICKGGVCRLLETEGLEGASDFSDRSFPWADWSISPSGRG
jgi:Fe-S-cluster-containing hydrogenase component 2